MNAENSEKSYIVPEGFNMGQWFLHSQLPLSTGAKLTYVVLATCSYRRDYSWASLEFLAEKVSASKRTVRRYLDELAAARFIEITSEKLMGAKRPIFRFLNHAVLGFEKVKGGRNTPPMRFEDLRKENGAVAPRECQISPQNPENMSVKSVKNDTRPYKVEGYEGNEEVNTPSKPPSAESFDLKQKRTPSDGDAGKVDVGISSGEEASQADDPAWAKAKSLLSAKLRKLDLDTYIEPLLFERAEARAVLRAPNSFFLNQIKKRFGDPLREAFNAAGFGEICFKEFTPEQQELHDQQTRERERKAEAMKEAAKQIAEEQVDFGALPLETLYDRLYGLYPRHERKQKGFIVFDRMARGDMLPSMPELMSAVRRQKNNNPKWQCEGGRYIPQLHRWLTERRWED